MVNITRRGACARKLEYHVNGKSRRVITNSLFFIHSLWLFCFHIQERTSRSKWVSQSFLDYTIERRYAKNGV